jgi:uncharacterized protein (TIGR02270 family)
MDVSGESVLWEVVERHLSEAEFLCARVLRAFESSDETLATLAAGAEQRLLVQVDGLAVGGEPVQARLLRPALDDCNAPEPRVVVACLALLSQGQRESVLAALRSALTPVPAAAETALALHAGGYETDAWIVAKLTTARDPELMGAMLRLAARRGIMVPQLDAFLCSATPAVVAGAAQAALYAPARSHTGMLEDLTRHTDAGVRAAALLGALADGSALARATCTAWAERTPQPHSQAMLWLALLDGTAAQAVLLAHLERASHRAPALFALGYSGRLTVIPQLLDAMASGDDACKRLAGEAFSVLTGLSLHVHGAQAPSDRGQQADDVAVPCAASPRRRAGGRAGQHSRQ